MRIITGKYKGRHFDIPRSFKARPTTDFAKEGLFNILNNEYEFEDLKVLDLFGGSGTTMIAAEQLGRKARLMELDERYADVIIERYEKFTGMKAQRIR